MRKKIQDRGIICAIAAAVAVLFLTCFTQTAIAGSLVRADGAFQANMATPRLIEITEAGRNINFEKYTITYHPNGGKGQTKDEKVDAKTDYTIKSQEYSRDYHIFSGWNTRPDGLGKEYSINQVINVTSNITLYAMWSPRI